MEEVDKHIVQTHGKVKISCQQCDRTLNSAVTLTNHVQACHVMKKILPSEIRLQQVSTGMVAISDLALSSRTTSGLFGQPLSQLMPAALYENRMAIPTVRAPSSGLDEGDKDEAAGLLSPPPQSSISSKSFGVQLLRWQQQ